MQQLPDGHYFVTGTDTDIGKTWVSCRLLRATVAAGKRCYGLKPIAAGCDSTEAGRRNNDALALIAASNVDLDYKQVNPLALVEPIAPHIAAADERLNVSTDSLCQAIRSTLEAQPANLVLIEGAGGWRVPLNSTESWSDWVRQMQLPVVLVVGMKLGCINHALLSADCIRADGVNLMAWVANDLGQPMRRLVDNIETLDRLMPVPRLRL